LAVKTEDIVIYGEIFDVFREGYFKIVDEMDKIGNVRIIFLDLLGFGVYEYF